MRAAKHRMRAELPKLYSQELLNNLFRHPYTRIDYVLNDLTVTRQTAACYLDTLAYHVIDHLSIFGNTVEDMTHRILAFGLSVEVAHARSPESERYQGGNIVGTCLVPDVLTVILALAFTLADVASGRR